MFAGLGWTVLQGRSFRDGTPDPRFVMLNRDFGVVLLDAAPEAVPDAVERLRRRLRAARFNQNFPGYLPAIACSLTDQDLWRLSVMLDTAFGAERPIGVKGGAWMQALETLLPPASRTAPVPAPAPAPAVAPTPAPVQAAEAPGPARVPAPQEMKRIVLPSVPAAPPAPAAREEAHEALPPAEILHALEPPGRAGSGRWGWAAVAVLTLAGGGAMLERLAPEEAHLAWRRLAGMLGADSVATAHHAVPSASFRGPLPVVAELAPPAAATRPGQLPAVAEAPVSRRPLESGPEPVATVAVEGRPAARMLPPLPDRAISGIQMEAAPVALVLAEVTGRGATASDEAGPASLAEVIRSLDIPPAPAVPLAVEEPLPPVAVEAAPPASPEPVAADTAPAPPTEPATEATTQPPAMPAPEAASPVMAEPVAAEPVAATPAEIRQPPEAQEALPTASAEAPPPAADAPAVTPQDALSPADAAASMATEPAGSPAEAAAAAPADPAPLPEPFPSVAEQAPSPAAAQTEPTPPAPTAAASAPAVAAPTPEPAAPAPAAATSAPTQVPAAPSDATAAAAPAREAVRPPERPAMPVASAPALPAELLATLMRRGDSMLALGDVSAARLLYERAATGGSAEAALAVGRTYDPTFLSGLNARGIRPDRAVAANWYRKAMTLGDREAPALLRRLGAE
jgi:hypothetical protein